MVTPSVHEQCWEPTASLKDIRKCIQNGHRVMIIMRGIPGSGKSYLASDLVSGTNGAIFSTDKYFMQSGVYRFDSSKLDEYHRENWKEAKNALLHGIRPIIIDNTNIFVTHMKPYIDLALKNLYEIYFVEPETEWKKNAKECARRNAHSVPEDKIAYMVECFEEVSLTDIIKPTQLRVISSMVGIGNSGCGLFLSKLNSHLSEHPEDVRKRHIQKQEVEGAVRLPCVDSQWALHEAADLLKFSYSDSLSEKNSTDKKESEQLFSLIPQQISRKILRTVGCNTDDLIRAFDLDPLTFMGDDFSWETEWSNVNFSYKKKMKGKAVQAGDGKILSDFELLLTLFPDEKPSDLLHILEIVGLKGALVLLKEMNANMNTCVSIDKNTNVKPESLSQTYYWWSEGEFEDIVGNSSTKFVPNYEMNRGIPEKLAPCTYTQCCDPEPIPEGYYRMEISVDMMKQLTELFGDSENISVLKTYVDLPTWLWRQIYFCWQGNAATAISSNQELVRILQNQGLASDKILESDEYMSIAERIELSALINDYSEVDRERIAECIRDNNCTPSASSPRYFTSTGLSVLKPDLESAHKDACELREEADKYNKQKHEMLLQAMNHQEFGAKMFYFAEAQKFGKKARDCIAEVNERLFEANTSNLFIDLHYMDVQPAIRLLKAKLSAADRPPELRHGRSGKKLVVLTGYGKLSDGKAKIKPAVLQWLENCGYEYVSDIEFIPNTL
ncbi:unnamed protein product [Litomosoides sigmodontis]|uniref:Smr domain-containing protein n=1 Tax=Litomosoides sigmodontis TaxID=42156 RepID=A0A3P6T0H9_LITSI|nr:unnamed protein product [Litomosoides sigmodontis]